MSEWTKTPPMRELGFYWLAFNGDYECADVVYVERLASGGVVASTTDGSTQYVDTVTDAEWYGPITPPLPDANGGRE